MAEEKNQGGGFERQMHDVDEKCSKCGAEIKQLPFKPDPEKADKLQCRDCYRQNRPPRYNR